MTPGELLIPMFRQSLESLSGWLDKAAEHARAAGRDPEDLTALRLAPDMFPLGAQIYVACFQALEPWYRLANAPLSGVAARIFDEQFAKAHPPVTLTRARSFLSDSIAALAEFDPATIAESESQALAHRLPNGLVFDFDGAGYIRDWAIPQFYFHYMTAYAILRNHGVELGKVDYVRYVLPRLRPDTAAQHA